MLQTLQLTRVEEFSDNYPYYLALSTDSLFVIDDKYECVECIVKGKDNDAYVLAADDEDMFLETLQLLKDCISSGKNPFDVYEFIY